MSAITKTLHKAFLTALGDYVQSTSALAKKPLLVDLVLPRPPRLRVYMYSLVGSGGTSRINEYKGVLRVPGQQVGQYGSFEFGEGRMTLAIAYSHALDVFVLWDASLHPKFKHGGNIQVHAETVHLAAATGISTQLRGLTDGRCEVVIACQSWTLNRAIDMRIAWTGSVTEKQWLASTN